jgi:hypothetical protein
MNVVTHESRGPQAVTRFCAARRGARAVKRGLLLSAALAMFSACSTSDSTDAGIALVSGTYQLVSVNGLPLPFTESSNGPVVVKLTASQLVTRKDGTFTETSTRSTTTASGTTTASVPTSGSYSVGGQVVSFTSTSADFSGLGSYEIGNLTIPIRSALYVYTKQ